MKVSQTAVDLIASFEGLRLHAYADPGRHILTIGYGTTIYPNGTKIGKDDRISEERAKEYLAHDVARFSVAVVRALGTVAVNQHQFDALVSFAYNVGARALDDSTLLRRLRAGDVAAAADEFLAWDKSDGTVLKGLARRRAAERKLFLKPVAAASHPVDHQGSDYLRLTRTEAVKDGLHLLELEYVEDGVRRGSLLVYSGTAGHQTFRTGPKSAIGSLEPLPEGRWRVRDMDWADGKDHYHGKVWNDGLGPVKIPLDYVGPGRTSRAAIEMHIDWNRDHSPGTAGCVGVRSIKDFRVLATWLRASDPKDLYVDWGLGTCPRP